MSSASANRAAIALSRVFAALERAAEAAERFRAAGQAEAQPIRSQKPEQAK